MTTNKSQYMNGDSAFRAMQHEIRSELIPFTQAPDLIVLLLIKNGIFKNASEIPGEILDLIEDLKSHADKMNYVINSHLFNYSEIEDNEGLVCISKDVIRPVYKMLQRFSERRRRKMSLSMQDELTSVNVLTSKQAASMAFYILLENAIKYSHVDSTVEVDCKIDGQDVVISVNSFGLEIMPDEEKRVFNKYYVGEVPRRRRVSGTGTGLYLCQEIMRGLRGEVKLARRNGPTVFKLYFPMGENLNNENIND